MRSIKKGIDGRNQKRVREEREEKRRTKKEKQKRDKTKKKSQIHSRN